MEKLQRESFNYFLHEANPANGLVIEKNEAQAVRPVLLPLISRWHLTRWLPSVDLYRAQWTDECHCRRSTGEAGVYQSVEPGWRYFRLGIGWF